jgi:methylated-DNA-[protein]-cysteine S-methyltransferase
MRHRIINTPTGPFAIIQHDDDSLATTWINRDVQRSLKTSREDRSLQSDLSKRLTAFFKGNEVDFEDVPNPQGSAFFVKCWNACRRIKRGAVASYAELARSAGSPDAFRAAGQAMRNNRLPIIIPCHRVIAASGRLHGFSGSCDAEGAELAVKRMLLKLEGREG